MKIQNKKIFIFCLTLFSILISTLIWINLNIPYMRSDIISAYSLQNYSSLNDPIKYLIFILLPLTTFILSKIYFENKKLSYLISSINENDNNLQNISLGKTLLFLFLIFLILEFFSIEFPYQKLDIFHSGQRFSATYKSYLDNSLWSGSYITSGIITEILGPKFIWKIFGLESIGLVRFYELILILLTKISLIILTFKITQIVSLKSTLKPFFFIILSFIILSLIDYEINSSDQIEARELPTLILLICFANFILNTNKKFIFGILIIGFLSVFSFFWSLDRAIIYNLLAVSFIIYLLIIKRQKIAIYTLISIIFFWICSFIYFGDEFNYFLNNTLDVLKNITNIHGIIHPIPFTDEINASRATKTLLTILFLLIYTVNLLLKNSNKKIRTKVFLLFLIFCSFLSYTYALGRSDGGHIKQAFGYPIIFLSIIVLYFVIKNIGKLKFSFNIQLPKFLTILLFLPIAIFIFDISVNNIINYKEKFTKFIYSKDKKFLNTDDINFVNQASIILQNEKCIQLYTYDSILLYLLKKPSCTKFHFIWSIASVNQQKELVDAMKNSTNVIISNGITDNWDIPFQKKYFIIDEYIKNEFTRSLNIINRDIKFKKF